MENTNMTEKLNTFTSIVLKDAQDKREKLLSEVEKEYSEKIDEKETELLQGAYESIQQNLRDARHEANGRILHAETQARRRLILKREEIINSVMELSREKLKGFTKSEGYGEWLIKKIEKALTEVGKGSKTVYISADDIKYKEEIEKLSHESRVTVEISPDREFLGGARVMNTDRKVCADYSFKEMLSEQKQAFLQSSGLTLD